MKNLDKIFKDILNFIKCVPRHLHKYVWTHIFTRVSKSRYKQKDPNVLSLLRV